MQFLHENEQRRKQSSSCSRLFTNLAPYLTPTAPPTRRMKRSACRKSPQNSTRVTQRGTCLRQVAGPHSRERKKKSSRGCSSHIFLTSSSMGTQTTASNLHSSWPARANSQKMKQNVYIYPFKQTKKNVATTLQYGKRNSNTHSAAILCHFRIGYH